MADGSGIGLGRHHGHQGHLDDQGRRADEVAADKALRSRKPKALEPGRYTVILEPRANARFLSLMTGIFNHGGGRAVPAAAAADSAAARTSSGATRSRATRSSAKLFTLKSDIGNPILRQTPIMGDNTPRGAGDLGGEGHPQELLAGGQRRPARDRQHEHGAGRQRTCRSRT